ncbi:MAG: carboxypeptidase regulatory-like domain-containing protein, partial [Chitinophagaceae bacterium]|nr:carboxypeptidase regulatory-like domain-containing protein [Chitinophagaceae bacterium]
RAEGVITDQQTGEGLAGVVVKSTDTDHTTTTDRNGKYKLYLPGKGSYAIVFQKPGYQVHEQKELSLCTGEATALSVALTATG